MPKEPMKTRGIRVPDKLWAAAIKRADERGEAISEAIRKFLERYSRPMPTQIGRPLMFDPCPVCGETVRQIATDARRPSPYAEPCGDRVAVTVWPDRGWVQLEKPE